MAGMGALPTALTALGGIGTLGGLLQQFMIKKSIDDYFRNAPGTASAGRTYDALTGGDPYLQQQVSGVAQSSPYGAFAAEQENRFAQAQADMRQRNTQIEQGISGRYEPLQQEAQRRFETPAISQSFVDNVVNRLRSGVNTAAQAASQQSQSAAAGRGLSADALEAMKQGYARDASNQVLQGRLGAEIQRELSNVAAEQQRFGDLSNIIGQYNAALVPQQNLGLQLLQDTGGIGRIGEYGLASDFARMGMTNEAAQMRANMGLSLGQNLMNTGVGVFNANKMADAAQGPGLWESTFANMLGTGGAYGLGSLPNILWGGS